MKIVINPKEDKKLLQNFPNDPYHDIIIHTSLSKLELVLAYLSIDSQFFANIDQNIKQIDLSHLNEQPLIKVLRSLYGAELIAYSIQEMIQLYKIIQILEIDDYKTMFKDSIKQYMVNHKQSSLLNSIQLFEFCLENQVLANEMKQFHFDNKLKILQTSKNYLQLGKISEENLSMLLLEFNSLKVEKGDQIINHILENYFNRKNIRPANYFMNEELQQLKIIWQKYHHKINFMDSDRLGNYKNGSSIFATTCNLGQLQLNSQVEIPKLNNFMRKSQTNFNTFSKTIKQPIQNNFVKAQKSEEQEENRILDAKIISLQTELKRKNDYIKNLRKQLKDLKEQKQKQKLPVIDSDKQDQQTSLFDGLKNYKTKKSKEGIIFDLQNIRQVESFDTTKQQNRVFKLKKQSKKIFQ